MARAPDGKRVRPGGKALKTVAWLIFLISYAGVACGSLPRLALDRTGFALLGAIAMVATGVLGLGAALDSIDAPTILLLYGLMVVSAQFRLGGFYTWTALSLSRAMSRPLRFLLLLMLVSAGLSAVLANDIVCLAFTPVVAVSLLRAGLNPVPFLLGLAVSSNIGSAATLIGNPQNMLIGQHEQLDFGRFLAWCGPPSVAALGLSFAVIAWLYRGQMSGKAPAPAPGDALEAEWPPLDRWQSGKGIAVTAVLMLLFFTRLPRELVALAAAGLLLCSRRMKTRSLLGLVDWHLITLFCGLFVVIRGLEETGVAAQAVDGLASRGIDMRNLYVLSGVSVALSNLVSNVPAAMLLLKFIDPGQPAQAYTLALTSTFAGNLITIGSIANLIVIEQARRCGVHIGFLEHARVGVPVTLGSLAIAALWIAWFGS